MPLEPQSGSRPRRLLIKSARLISPLLGILVVVAVLSGCPYVPPEVLDPPAGDFSRAMSTFAKSAREEHLASYRHEGRRDLFIKVALTTLETNWTDASLVEALSGQAPKNFLCLPNYGYERMSKASVARLAIALRLLAMIFQRSSLLYRPIMQSRPTPR